MSAPGVTLPRRLPGGLRWRQHLGGVFRQMTWMIVLLGAVVATIFLSQADLGCRRYDRTGPGVVERVEATSASINKQRIYQIEARFEDDRGRGHVVRSYGESPPVVGAAVQVHYQADDPEVALIDGLRAARFGRLILFVLVMPTLGLVFLLSQVPSSRRVVHLLRHGLPTEGVIVGRREGRLRINRRRNSVLSFEYAVAGGRTQRCEVSTFRPAALEDQPREPMLYDPAAPGRATTLDALPGAPRLAADGAIVASGGGMALLILPTLAVAALLVLGVVTRLG